MKVIRTTDDYENVLARINQIMDSEPGTDEFRELEWLTEAVEMYEEHELNWRQF